MIVARIPCRRCDACGKFAVCYLAGGGWNCSTCAPPRVVAGKLADALDALAVIIRDCPEAYLSVVQALCKCRFNMFLGGLFLNTVQWMESGVVVQSNKHPRGDITGIDRNDIVTEIYLSLLKKAKCAHIAYDFPDLSTAYKKGRERGLKLDNAFKKRHSMFVKLCKKRGLVPPEPRKINAADSQRWATNYLRHECSDYKHVYEWLQCEARNILKQYISQDDLCVVYEQIHQIIKNRVQDKIAEMFPKLTDVCMEQKV